MRSLPSLVFIALLTLSPITLGKIQIEPGLQQQPVQLTQSLGQQLIQELSQLPQGENRKKQVKQLIQQQLLPYLDSKYVSLYILGKQLKTLKKQQVLDFKQAFESHLVNTYTNALVQFDNQQIQFAPSNKQTIKGRTVTVKARIIDKKRPEVSVAFKLRKDKKSGDWRIYDFVAEGISLLQAKRSEFSQLFRQQGFEATLKQLQQQK